jgi:TP901 family phage tail tape measure protein
MALRVSLFLNDKGSKKLKSFAGKVKDVGFGFAKLGVVGGAAIAGISTKLAGDFSKGLREVSTLMKGVTENDIKVMGKELESLSGKTGLALNSLVKARYDIVSSGFSDAAQSAQVLGAAAKLAVGGVTSAAQAADILTTSLNAYSLSADKAEDVADILFTTVRLGKTTMTELSASMANMLPIAKAANVRLEDSAAALALVTANGINTAEASTSLKNAFKNLAAPTDDAKRAMEEAGIQTRYFEDGTMDLVSTIGQFKGLPLDALKEFIPDIRAINSIQIMADKVDLLADNIVEFDNRAGASREAFDKMMKEFNNKAARLKNNFARIFREIGRGIIDAITPAVDESNRILETLGDIGWDVVFKKIRDEWTKLGAIFQTIFKIIFRPLPDIIKKVFMTGGKAAIWAFKMGWQAAGISIKSLIFPSDEQENLIKLVNAVGADAAAAFLANPKWETLGPEVAKIFAEGTREEMLAKADELGLSDAVELALGSLAFVSKESAKKITDGLKAGMDEADLTTAFGAEFKKLGENLDFSKFISSEGVATLFGFNEADLQELQNAIDEALKIITDGQKRVADETKIWAQETKDVQDEVIQSWIRGLEELGQFQLAKRVELEEAEKESIFKRMEAWAELYTFWADNTFQVAETMLSALNNFHQADLANIKKSQTKQTESARKTANDQIKIVQDRVKAGTISEQSGANQIQLINAGLQTNIDKINADALEKERESKRKQKKWAIAGTIIDTAQAIMKIWADPGGPIFKTAMTAATVALGASQVAKINAQTFAFGGKVKGMQFGGGVSPQSDSVPALLTPGEIVSTRAASNQFGSEITRMNQVAQDGDQGATGGQYSFDINIVAMDGASVKDVILENPEQFADAFVELMKRRHIILRSTGTSFGKGVVVPE